MKSKYLWLTDLHLDKVLPWTKLNFIYRIIKENPAGIFLTGDISNGIFTCLDLKILATLIECPIYFVLGNHDYHFSSLAEMHLKIRDLCKRYKNLVWMDESKVISLTSEVALIGAGGWYDASNGNPDYLKLTPDWMLIKDFRDLPTMKDRIEAFQELAKQSCDIISSKLEECLDLNYKTIYILTHVPPWTEATRDVGTVLEKFWLPYNVNLRLGKTIEKIMKEHKNRNITVLSGHTHSDAWIHVARNIECKVNKAKYYGFIRNEEHIFI